MERLAIERRVAEYHLHPFYQREFGYKQGDYPRAEKYCEQAITLPIFPRMTKEDVEDVISAVRKVIGYYRKRG